ALSGIKDIPDLTRTVLVDSNLQAQADPAAERLDPAARQADPAAGQPAGSLQEFHLAPNEIRIKYSANLPGILTVADSYSKGWRAEVNGKEEPVLRVNGVFRGVRLAAPGEVEVRFWYRPPLWDLSLVLCGLGALLLSGFLFLRSYRR